MTKIRFPLFFSLLFTAMLVIWVFFTQSGDTPPPPLLWQLVFFLFGLMTLAGLRFSLFPIWAFDEKGIYRYGLLPGTIRQTYSWAEVGEVRVEIQYSRKGPDWHYYALCFTDPKTPELPFHWLIWTRLRDVARAVQFAQAANPNVVVDPRILTKLEAPFFTFASWSDMGAYLVEIPVFVGIALYFGDPKKDAGLTSPWFHWFLIALGALEIWLLFLFVYKLIHRKDHVDTRPASPPEPNVFDQGLSLLKKPGPIFVTYFLLILIAGVFACELIYALDKTLFDEPDSLSLIAFGASGRDFVLGRGQWYRLLSSTLLHANFHHLFYNAFALYMVGYALENMVGLRWYFVIFFLSGLGGSLVSLFFGPEQALSLGASGAIMGLMGAAMVISFKLPKGTARSYIHWLIFPSFVLSLIPVSSKGGELVDISAHAGGALVGVVLALFLYEIWAKDQPLPGLETMAGFFSVGALGALLWAVYVPAHSYDHNRDLAALLLPFKDIPPTYEKAVQRSAKLLAQYPHDPRVLDYRATAFSKAGNLEAEKRELRAALGEEDILNAYYSKDFEFGLRLDLAEILVWQRRRSEATQVIKPVCESKTKGKIEERLKKLKLCD